MTHTEPIPYPPTIICKCNVFRKKGPPWTGYVPAFALPKGKKFCQWVPSGLYASSHMSQQRHTDKHAGSREAGRHVDRLHDTQEGKQLRWQTGTQVERLIGRQTKRQMDRQVGRQSEWQTERHAGRWGLGGQKYKCSGRYTGKQENGRKGFTQLDLRRPKSTSLKIHIIYHTKLISLFQNVMFQF